MKVPIDKTGTKMAKTIPYVLMWIILQVACPVKT